MEVTVHSTDRIVSIQASGGAGQIQARVWEGKTDTGIPVVMLVPRIAAPNEVDGVPVDHTPFEHELREHSAPTDLGSVFPLRMII